jgi:hypothetical protein
MSFVFSSLTTPFISLTVIPIIAYITIAVNESRNKQRDVVIQMKYMNDLFDEAEKNVKREKLTMQQFVEDTIFVFCHLCAKGDKYAAEYMLFQYPTILRRRCVFYEARCLVTKNQTTIDKAGMLNWLLSEHNFMSIE